MNKENINPRYAAFQRLGGGPNWEYMHFINLMKIDYIRSKGYNGQHPEWQPIVNHDEFTKFIQCFVDRETTNKGDT